MPTAAEAPRTAPPAAPREAPLGVMSMCGRLRSALVVAPDAAGWGPEAAWRDAGYRVRVHDGSEISANGDGGPTCLTRPILRDPPESDPPGRGAPGRAAGRRA